MAEKIILKGRALAPGVTEGEALVSKESLVWSHGVNPPTGKIVDVRVAVCGECVKDKVLVYPLGKGFWKTPAVATRPKPLSTGRPS